ncbi:CHAT domain-containing protein [Coniochaeta sp. 2T2.1]|nr:CHAT domain-containing protein [Coniochaeta sp. 2T2.1]
MGNMPLHATGEYTPRRPHSTNCTMDYVVSCYTPSFSSLRYSRYRQRELGRSRVRSAVAIAMSDLEGAQRLMGVSKELSAFQRCFPGAHVVHEPTKKDAINQVLTNNIVHFACHGVLNATKPEQAALLVNNDVADGLTFSDLDKLVCSRGRLAYLSACSTAANPSRESLSEAVHLTTGFQLAGFPHVVGTLWQADDDAAVDIAELFYTSLTARSAAQARASDQDESDAGLVEMQGDAVAAALDEAITRFRSRDGISEANFLAWAPFVYFGS